MADVFLILGLTWQGGNKSGNKSVAINIIIIMYRGSLVALFTVDRKSTLSEGIISELRVYDDVNPPELADHVTRMFPDGVSAHGELYFLRNESQTMLINPMLELLFEYVRRAHFPHLPSRFQSMFAVGSKEQAIEFRSQFGDGDSPIYRVEAENQIKADMSLLHAGNSILVTSYFADLYWSGKSRGESAFWEYILKCPVTVAERVA